MVRAGAKAAEVRAVARVQAVARVRAVVQVRAVARVREAVQDLADLMKAEVQADRVAEAAITAKVE